MCVCVCVCVCVKANACARTYVKGILCAESRLTQSASLCMFKMYCSSCQHTYTAGVRIQATTYQKNIFESKLALS